MPADKSTDGTAALDKALDVLDAVGASPAGLSQQALAERLALPRTTLYRLLGRLVARGLLRRDPQRRVYGLGQRCFEYARAAYSMPDLVAAAGPELRALRDMTGETTYLATLDGLETISLERCDGAHGQRSHAAIGQRKPLHCTSQGKAMLAALPAAERDAVVRDLTLSANTPRTIIDRRRLQAELKLTATRGWSIDDEEITLGVRCCGAAIVDGQGQVRGAISVAGPAFRLTTERIELIGPEVADAARRIGAQLAASTPAAMRAAGEAQVVDGPWAFDGAAPCWHAGEGALYWADRLAPSVHRTTAEGDRVCAELDAPIQHLLPHAEGALVQAADRWWLVARDGTLRDGPPLPRRRFAAVCAAPDGRLWACQAGGDRWRIAEPDATGGWRLAEAATALAWDAAGTSLAIVGTSGSLYLALPGSSALQRLATVPKGSGVPSGLARDGAGGVWTALRGGWSAARFEADGTLDRVIALPVPCPTDLGFGGPGGRTLYVTSARDAVNREALDAAPLSGRLFALADAADGVVPAPLRQP
jgi:IclR family transcriptional regulator, acetate operon repressor